MQASNCRNQNKYTQANYTYCHSAIPRWITDEWPKSPHIPLLETRLRELMQFVFGFDPRIEWVDIALSKPWACPEAHGVGVRMALSRDEYERVFGAGPHAPAAVHA